VIKPIWVHAMRGPFRRNILGYTIKIFRKPEQEM